MFKKTPALFLFVFLFFTTALRAENLLQVYQQALVNDPTFKKAQADWHAAELNVAIARSGTGQAGSGLFPYIDVSAEAYRSYQDQELGPLSASGYFSGGEYGLTITQPIFNYATWKSISSAQFGVKAATATYLSATQDLIFRSAQAYFAVLKSASELTYTLAQKAAYYRQWITTKQQFDVGLVAITGVYEAKASYDQATAQEIEDRNTLADSLEDLRAITKHYYAQLAPLKPVIPLLLPRPQNIDVWVEKATAQNYTLQSALYAMLQQREIIKQTEGNRYPTLNGKLAFTSTTIGLIPHIGGLTGGGLDSLKTNIASAGLSLDFPVYKGGYVSHTVEQAKYNYLSASNQLEITQRDITRQTREAYLAVDTSVHKIKADDVSIISARSKLKSTQAGYSVGTRTMVDVLDAFSNLYQAQSDWAQDRCDYVVNILSLKEQAGSLSPVDLTEINRWLDKPIVLNAIGKTSSKNDRFQLSRPQKSKKINGGTYSIQILATHLKQQAEFYTKRYPQTFMIKEAQWYKIYWGRYPTQKAARGALTELPTAVLSLKPWIVLIKNFPSHSRLKG